MEESDKTRLSEVFQISITALNTLFTSKNKNLISIAENLVTFVNDNKLDKIADEILELKEIIAKKDIEIENEMHSHEGESEKSLKEKELLEKNVDNLQQQIKKLQEDYDSENIKNIDLVKQSEKFEAENKDLNTKLQEIDIKYSDIYVKYKQQLTIIEEYKIDIKTQEEKYSASRDQVKDLEIEVADLKSKVCSNELELRNSEQSFKLMEKQNEEYKSDLEKKSKELSDLKIKTNSQISELKNQGMVIKNESDLNKKMLDTANIGFIEQSNKTEQLVKQVESLKAKWDEREINFNHELEKQSKITQLYENVSQSAKKRILDLESDLANEQVKSEEALESFNKERRIMKSTINELNIKKDALEEELNRGDTSDSATVEEKDVLDSASSIAINYQTGGRSFTDVYTDYCRVQEENKQLKVENREINEVLQEVMENINEKAPFLEKQKQEYDDLVLQYTTLSKHLTKVMDSKNMFEQKTTSLQSEYANCEVENKRLNQAVEDLSRQVQSLMGSTNPRPAMVGDSIPHNELITYGLVEVNDLEDMHAQNVRLLQTARHLSEQLLKADETVRRNMDDLESEALEESKVIILDLKEKLGKANEVADTTLKEMEMLRRIVKFAKHHYDDSDQDPSAEANKIVDDIEEYKKLIKDYSEELERLRTETGINAKIMEDCNKKLQTELSSERVTSSRCRSQMEFANEKSQIQSNTMKSLEIQVSELRKQSNSYYDIFVKEERKVQELGNKLNNLNIEHEKMKNENNNLIYEVKLYKKREADFLNEKATLIQERNQSNQFIEQLKIFQSNIQNNDGSYRERLNNQLDVLEKENSSLKDRSERLNSQVNLLTHQRTIELKEQQVKLDKLNSEFTQTKEKLILKESEYGNMTKKVGELEGARNQLETRLDNLINPTSDGDEGGNLRTILSLRKELHDANDKINALEGSVIQFQSISKANEEALKSFKLMYEEFKASMDQQLEQCQEQLTTTNEKCVSLTSQVDEQKSEFDIGIKKLEDDLIMLQSQLDDKQREFDELIKGNQEFEERKKDLEMQILDAKKEKELANQNYQRELQVHAQTSISLSMLDEKVKAMEENTNQFKAQNFALTMQLESKVKDWSEEKNALAVELKEKDSRVADLKKQNELLHEHFKAMNKDSSQANEQTDDPDVKVKRLQDTLVYLRGENELLEIKFEDVSKSLTKTTKAFTESQKELTELQLRFNELQKESPSGDSKLKLQKLMRNDTSAEVLFDELQQLSVLKESNAMLRAEKDKAKDSLQAVKDELEILRAKLQPLQDEIRLLKSDLEAANKDKTAVLQDRDMWKKRTEQLLTKYDKIDPVLHEQVKSKVSELEVKLKTADEALSNQLQKFNELNINAKARVGKLSEHCALWKTKTETANSQLLTKDIQLKQLQADIDALNLKFKSTDGQSLDKQELIKCKTKIAELEKSIEDKIEVVNKYKENTSKSVQKTRDIMAQYKKRLEEIDGLKKELAKYSGNIEGQAQPSPSNVATEDVIVSPEQNVLPLTNEQVKNETLSTDSPLFTPSPGFAFSTPSTQSTTTPTITASTSVGRPNNTQLFGFNRPSTFSSFRPPSLPFGSKIATPPSTGFGLNPDPKKSAEEEKSIEIVSKPSPSHSVGDVILPGLQPPPANIVEQRKEDFKVPDPKKVKDEK